MELPNFNLKFKRNSFTYLLTKSWNSFSSGLRLSSDEMTAKVHCKILAFKNVS